MEYFRKLFTGIFKIFIQSILYIQLQNLQEWSWIGLLYHVEFKKHVDH